MEILLNPERQKFIQKQLETGKYRNHDEAINVALLLLEKFDREYAEWLEETRQKVAIGLAQLERGESLDVEQVIDGILDRFRQAKEIIK